jgi:hypothetical protein
MRIQRYYALHSVGKHDLLIFPVVSFTRSVGRLFVCVDKNDMQEVKCF